MIGPCETTVLMTRVDKTQMRTVQVDRQKWHLLRQMSLKVCLRKKRNFCQQPYLLTSISSIFSSRSRSDGTAVLSLSVTCTIASYFLPSSGEGASKSISSIGLKLALMSYIFYILYLAFSTFYVKNYYKIHILI